MTVFFYDTNGKMIMEIRKHKYGTVTIPLMTNTRDDMDIKVGQVYRYRLWYSFTDDIIRYGLFEVFRVDDKVHMKLIKTIDYKLNENTNWSIPEIPFSI